jgi:transposase InsO family protein
MSNGRARRSIPMATEPPDREAVDIVLGICRDARSRGEAIPNAVIAEYAEWAGTSAPTFRRWIRDGRPAPERRRFEIDKEFEQALALHRTIAHTVRKRAAQGIEAPVHVRTYQRAVKRKLSPYVIVALRKGEKAARQHELTIRQFATHRNAVWRIDVFYARRRVLTANGRGVRDAYVILVIDDASGAIAGCTVVRDEPETADALHAVSEAMRSTPELWAPHGAPGTLVHDNAGIFTTLRFWQPLRRPLINVRCQAIAPYTPRLNGKIERAIGTLRTLLATPLESGGLEDLTGRSLVDADRAAVPLRALIAEIKAACVEYNNLEYRDDRTISKAQAWEQLPGVVRPVAPELLSPMMRRAPGLITREGVGFENDAFLHHRMRDKLGRHVELRYRDMDDTWVEVHYAGKLLCTALSTEILAADQDIAEKVIFTRATDRRKAHDLLAEAKRVAEDYAQAEQNVANPPCPDRPKTPGALAKKPDPFGYRRDHD